MMRITHRRAERGEVPRLHSIFPSTYQRFIDHDTCEPWQEPTASTKLIQIIQCLAQSLQHGILGSRVVSKDLRRNLDESRVFCIHISLNATASTLMCRRISNPQLRSAPYQCGSVQKSDGIPVFTDFFIYRSHRLVFVPRLPLRLQSGRTNRL